MLFRRRSPAVFSERLRVMLWPRRSVWRSAKYYGKRALRLNASPHSIAVGIAAGVFVSFLPFLGFHFVLAAGMAWFLAGNVVASAIGTTFGNPLTYPLIWGGTYEAGELILEGMHLNAAAPLSLGELLQHLDFSQLWGPILEPMAVGAIPLGLFFAVMSYALTYRAAAIFRERRLRRLASIRAQRSESAGTGASIRQ